MYFCPGATHAPHHAPEEWIERYAGKFDMGYEAYRELVFARQQEHGIFPPDAELSPLNPYAEEESPDGKPWPALDVVRPWDALSDDERRLFSRMAEVYVYLPNSAEVPELAAVNIRNRSYSIAVDVDVTAPAVGGVQFSHGARFGGHALYVRDGKLKYVENLVGDHEQVVESDREIPTGAVVLGASFTRQGDRMPTTGTLAPFIDGEQVGKGGS